MVIPQLECSLSVEFDQFSTVGDVLRQVLDLSQPQLDPIEGYTVLVDKYKHFSNCWNAQTNHMHTHIQINCETLPVT